MLKDLDFFLLLTVCFRYIHAFLFTFAPKRAYLYYLYDTAEKGCVKEREFVALVKQQFFRQKRLCNIVVHSFFHEFVKMKETHSPY